VKVCSLLRAGLPEDVRFVIGDDGSVQTYLGAVIPNKGDLAALELALRWREHGDIDEVVSCVIGGDGVEPLLRLAKAMGVDGLVRVDGGHECILVRDVSRTIAEAVKELACQIVLCGHEAPFDSAGLAAYELAACLRWSVATGIGHVTTVGNVIEVVRTLERGMRESLQVNLPAVIAVRAGIVEPRYVGRSALARVQIGDVPTFDVISERPGRDTNASITVGTWYSRPAPAGIYRPDESLRAIDRLEQVVSAGVSEKTAIVLSGDVDEISRRLAHILAEYVGLRN